MPIDFDGNISGECLGKRKGKVCELPPSGHYHCGKCHKQYPFAFFRNAGSKRSPNKPGNCDNCNPPRAPAAMPAVSPIAVTDATSSAPCRSARIAEAAAEARAAARKDYDTMIAKRVGSLATKRDAEGKVVWPLDEELERRGRRWWIIPPEPSFASIWKKRRDDDDDEAPAAAGDV